MWQFQFVWQALYPKITRRTYSLVLAKSGNSGLSGQRPPRANRMKANIKGCREVAKELVECLNITVDEVKSVRVKKITVDIDLAEDC
jgi:hypothetical protein